MNVEALMLKRNRRPKDFLRAAVTDSIWGAFQLPPLLCAQCKKLVCCGG